MHDPTPGYILLAILVVSITIVAWLSLRYTSYLKKLRSGTGSKPDPVWKPFWFT